MKENRGIGFQLRPTAPAEEFRVNPEPGDPGIFFDELTVVFMRGTPPSRVDEIVDGIGARIRIRPSISTAYRIKLPSFVPLETGFEYFDGQPEVAGILPALNFVLEQDDFAPSEGTEDWHEIARLPEAWEIVGEREGTVGSRRLTVAVIDGFMDVDHPDLTENMWINQDEIPDDVADQMPDVDGDGVISFVDVNHPAAADVRPPDVDGDGRISPRDLLTAGPDNPWVDSVDADPIPDVAGAPLRDDLVGWNFGDGERQHQGAADDRHATKVAGIAGAVGDNGLDVAGGAWEVSIVPIQVRRLVRRADDTVDQLVLDVSFYDALRYVEFHDFDVVNISQGWTGTADVNLSCAVPRDERENVFKGLPPDAFEVPVTSARAAMSEILDPDGTTLYVLSAGNNGLDVTDASSVLKAPVTPIVDIIGDRSIVVGNARDRTISARNSNYGDRVDLWAPGTAIETLLAFLDTVACSGTSCAAPVVAGVAILVMQMFPEMTAREVKSRLVETATRSLSVQTERCTIAEIGRIQRPCLDAAAAVSP